MATAVRREIEGGEVRRAIVIGLACAVLTLFFFVVRFPYDVFRASLVNQLAAATGAELEIGGLAGGVSLGGLTLVAEPVTLRWPTGTSVELERAALRPAWSLSWFRGSPALHVDLEAPAGRVAGTLWPEEPLAFQGSVHELTLERLPPEVLAAGAGLALTGVLDADFDLRFAAGVPAGELELDLANGAFSAPGLPVSIPFERLQAALGLAAGALQIASASLEGPMIQGTAEGKIGLADDPTLDLQVDLHVADPGVRGMIAPLGVRLDQDGRAKLRLQGTFSSPILR